MTTTTTPSFLAADVWKPVVSTADSNPISEAKFPTTAVEYLASKGYLHSKTRKMNDSSPVYNIRILYADGTKARFPFSEWSNVHRYRLHDQNHAPIFEKHVAWSNEGIRVFFCLEYPNPTEVDDVVEHGLIAQDVMREYYKSHTNADFTFWMLNRSPGALENTSYQIVFPCIIVNSERARQLTLSVKERIRRKSVVSVNLVDSVEDHMVSAPPVYSLDLGRCGACTVPAECLVCTGTGRQLSTNGFTPIAIIGSKGESLVDKLEWLLEHDKGVVIADTSVVPTSDLGLYTPGYQTPDYEPGYIPVPLRSTDPADVGVVGVYKKDRQSMNKWTGVYTPEPNPVVWRMVQEEIRKYHEAYAHAVVSKVDRLDQCLFVNLSSGGRSFCRILDPMGKVHQRNGVFFKIDQHSIVQGCHDSACRVAFKSAKVKRRLTQPTLKSKY